MDLTALTDEELLALEKELEQEVSISSFSTWCVYNFRDVSGIVDLDQKFKFIQLVNQMAHENTCLFENILGTVRYVETGIALRAHKVLGVRVPDKRVMTDGEKVEGALVLNPKIGLHELVGSVDLNSLYPNVMRSLNISPEMFRGQFTCGEDDWRGITQKDEATHEMVDQNGELFAATGAEWFEILTRNKWAISAYGTVFDQSQGPGLVPDTIAFWFNERKRLQAEKKKWANEVKRLEELIKAQGHDNQLAVELEHAEKQEEHYSLLQLTKKIQLNSTYGALLNQNFRFGRKELGASVTACGRQITTHMMETIHSLLEPDTPVKIVKTTEVEKDGKVSHVYVIDSNTVIYGDTDSVEGSSLVSTSLGQLSIENLFNEVGNIHREGDKEYAVPTAPLLTPCLVDGAIQERQVLAVYRHKVKKERFRITLDNGKSVVVTGDHSIMVMRNGNLQAIRAKEINVDTDTAISL